MKRTRVIGAATFAVAVIATLAGREVWARTRQPAPTMDESALNRDLDLAAGVGVSLVPMGGQPLLVAAELAPQGERTNTKAPRAATKPRRRATPSPAPEPDPQPVDAPSVAEDPQGTDVAQASMAGEGAPAGDVADASAPAAMPRPTPNPVSYPTEGAGSGYPAGQGDGGYGTGGRGGGIGGAIGVILRGGVVDGDHCDPRGRRRRSGGIVIGGSRGGRSSGIDIGTVMRGGSGTVRAPRTRGPRSTSVRGVLARF
jgi:hypothetical protein